VKIFGEEYQVKAQIEMVDSFSGHADHSELLDYFEATTGSKEKVFLVHGEPSRSNALCEALREIHDGDVEVGELGKTIDL